MGRIKYSAAALVLLAMIFGGRSWGQIYVPQGSESDAGKFLKWNGTRPLWSTLPTSTSGSGITSLGGLTGATQTFATGTSGTNFTISSSGTAHTFNLPTASASARGLLSSTDWSTFNAKAPTASPTFTGTITTPFTAGSIPYIGTGGAVRQNNGGLFWDSTNARLGIGTAGPTAQISLGNWNSGGAGPTNGPQIRLSGLANTGANFGSGGSAVKLQIEGYDNDGTVVYPIYLMDENNLVDFWFKNKATVAGLSTAFFNGSVGVGDSTPASSLTVGNGDLFQVNSSGNIVKLNNVTTSFPSSNALGSLNNDGAGNLSWEGRNHMAGKYYEIYDDFLSANGNGNTGAVGYQTGAQASVQSSFAPSGISTNRAGVVFLKTDTLVPSGAGLGWGADVLTLDGGAAIFEADVKIPRKVPAGSDANEDWSYFIGFFDVTYTGSVNYTAIAPYDGAYFYAHNDTNSFNWIVACSNNLTRTNKRGNGIAVDTNNYTRLRIESDNDAGLISFYINGVLYDTIKNSLIIPRGVSRLTGPNIKVVKTSKRTSGAQTNGIFVDRVFIRKNYVPTR